MLRKWLGISRNRLHALECQWIVLLFVSLRLFLKVRDRFSIFLYCNSFSSQGRVFSFQLDISHVAIAKLVTKQIFFFEYYLETP